MSILQKGKRATFFTDVISFPIPFWIGTVTSFFSNSSRSGSETRRKLRGLPGRTAKQAFLESHSHPPASSTAGRNQRRQGSQPLTQGPGARHRPPEGARSPYPPRADPTRSAGAAPAHSIIRSEMAWRRPRPGSLGSPPVRAPRLRSPPPCRATAGREGAS